METIVGNAEGKLVELAADISPLKFRG